MDPKLAPLNQLLQKLISHHRQLLECVRAERAALVSAQIKAIHDATCFKEGLIEQIRQLEAERARLVRALAAEWRRPEAELSLGNIILHVQGFDLKSADQLRSTFQALAHLVQRVREQNEDNRALLERSLAHLQEMKRNVLGESAPKQGAYGPQGQKTAPAAGARFVSREA